MNICLLSVLTVRLSTALAVPGGYFNFFPEYFSALGVGSVAFFGCNDKDENLKLNKHFSMKGIPFNWMNLEKYDEVQSSRLLEAKYHKQGIVVDLKCPHGMEVLQMANANHFFLFYRSMTYWLILYPNTVPKNILYSLINDYVPKVTDLYNYVMGPYKETKKNSSYLLEINERENAEVLRNYKAPTLKPTQVATNETVLLNLLQLNILLNNKIIIGVPDFEREISYVLYHVYQITKETRPKIEEAGTFRLADNNNNNNYEGIPGILGEKRNLENEILKGAIAVFFPEKFTTIDDIATKDEDIWAKISYPHLKLLSEDLNFRFVLRYFDFYGFSKNGTFSHLMGFLQLGKSDFSAAASFIRKRRMEFLSFLICPFPVDIGLLFIEPPLPTVTNVFVLPFAKSIWLSYMGIIVVTVFVMILRTIISRNVFPLDQSLNLSDIGNYVLGSICQQGLKNTPSSVSDRVSILSLLLASVILLSAYSACIVTLMQTSSSAISTMEDMTHSDFEIGIQETFPFFKVAMQEAFSPVEKEFYEKKVLKRDKKKVFLLRDEGIEKVRTGLFAFEVELYAAYKYTRKYYDEHEKCGLKMLEITKHSPLCFPSLKNSPYKEIFAQRYNMQNEAGLFKRTYLRWIEQKPTCEGSRLGFVSIGIKEFRHIMLAFIYGVSAALIIFLAELFLSNKISKIFRYVLRTFNKFSRCLIKRDE